MRIDFVQAGTVKLQYFEHGTGPEQLVLVHGYRSSGRIWRLVQEALDPDPFPLPGPQQPGGWRL